MRSSKTPVALWFICDPIQLLDRKHASLERVSGAASLLARKPSPEQIALNRVTFGARDTDIRYVQQIGWNAWVEDQLNPPKGDDPELARYLKAQTLHIEYPAYDFQGLKWPAVKEERPFQYLDVSGREMWRLTREVLFR